jgi:ElaB/YqjD/DUF883 family membrane-anchored ribosome-binding protein
MYFFTIAKTTKTGGGTMVDKDMSDAAQSAAASAGQAADTAKEYAFKGVDAARDYAKKGYGAARDYADTARDMANKGYGAAREYANQGYDTAREYASAGIDAASRMNENLTEFVRNEPWIAMAAAFAVGYVAARLLRRLSI